MPPSAFLGLRMLVCRYTPLIAGVNLLLGNFADQHARISFQDCGPGFLQRPPKVRPFRNWCMFMAVPQKNHGLLWSIARALAVLTSQSMPGCRKAGPSGTCFGEQSRRQPLPYCQTYRPAVLQAFSSIPMASTGSRDLGCRRAVAWLQNPHNASCRHLDGSLYLSQCAKHMTVLNLTPQMHHCSCMQSGWQVWPCVIHLPAAMGPDLGLHCTGP